MSVGLSSVYAKGNGTAFQVVVETSSWALPCSRKFLVALSAMGKFSSNLHVFHMHCMDLSSLWSGKVGEDTPQAYGYTSVWETQKKLLVFGFETALAVVYFWNVSQHLEDLLVCLTSSLYI